MGPLRLNCFIVTSTHYLGVFGGQISPVVGFGMVVAWMQHRAVLYAHKMIVVLILAVSAEDYRDGA